MKQPFPPQEAAKSLFDMLANAWVWTHTKALSSHLSIHFPFFLTFPACYIIRVFPLCLSALISGTHVEIFFFIRARENSLLGLINFLSPPLARWFLCVQTLWSMSGGHNKKWALTWQLLASQPWIIKRMVSLLRQREVLKRSLCGYTEFIDLYNSWQLYRRVTTAYIVISSKYLPPIIARCNVQRTGHDSWLSWLVATLRNKRV